MFSKVGFVFVVVVLEYNFGECSEVGVVIVEVYLYKMFDDLWVFGYMSLCGDGIVIGRIVVSIEVFVESIVWFVKIDEM